MGFYFCVAFGLLVLFFIVFVIVLSKLQREQGRELREAEEMVAYYEVIVDRDPENSIAAAFLNQFRVRVYHLKNY